MKKLYVIAGATASGKTAAAIELAKKIDGEVISADSMQVYKGMDIGTAKPTQEEMAGIPHHMLSIIEPDQSFSAAEFQARAYDLIEEIFARKKAPILAGGTGFYINAVIYGAQFSNTAHTQEAALRQRLEDEARLYGAELVHNKLAAADPAYAATLHPNNIKRVARALAYCQLTGKLFSEHNAEQREKKLVYDTELILLSMERKQLYERINARTIRMFEAGLVEEVRGLLEKGYGKGLASMQGIGYKETVQLIDGELTQEEAIAKIQQATRNYAKRQETWFKNQL
ncbi:MAG: tRNA (adenosine(37)-N6)-dimethylallyltransferase MiaA [Defluviitaleaceae bacterium]|nr:tRNA (adenosine(37)-N6)-dimethylallyltransferase MiaA [Defluviitaleaceae bacterium]